MPRQEDVGYHDCFGESSTDLDVYGRRTPTIGGDGRFLVKENPFIKKLIEDLKRGGKRR